MNGIFSIELWAHIFGRRLLMCALSPHVFALLHFKISCINFLFNVWLIQKAENVSISKCLCCLYFMQLSAQPLFVIKLFFLLEAWTVTVCLCFYTVINQAIQMEYFDSLMVLRQHLNWTASIWFSYLWVFLFLALWISIKESKWYLPWRFDYGGWNKHCSQTAYFIFAQPPSDNLSCVCSANFWSRIRLAVLLWFLVVICLLSQHAKSKKCQFFFRKTYAVFVRIFDYPHRVIFTIFWKGFSMYLHWLNISPSFSFFLINTGVRSSFPSTHALDAIHDTVPFNATK